ncbi:hypothetical protein TruAng_007946 [Truncatella angustata]|nr:hypothetical protein TruAng_007946 [Truncatella angustata]
MGLFSTDPDQLNVYGYKFKWGTLHQAPEELQRLTCSYDSVATDALNSLDKLVPPGPIRSQNENQETIEAKNNKKHRNLYKLVREHAETSESVGKLWREINNIPDWVDWESIERGQKVFWRYGGPAITALTFVSLLGGMSSGRTVETLDRTGGFNARVVRQRLLETTQHTLGVHKDIESIKPGGEGFESSVRVRLLHAVVRQRIVKLAEEKPDYFDIKKYGLPINDLDCIGTIATFSATLLWIGLPRQGIFLRQQEIADYLALWRYVSYLMGTPHDWLATPETAKAMMESLLVSEIKPTKKSGTLANNIITGLEAQPPTYASRGFLNAETYWLNGSELCQEMNIEKPSLLIPSWDENHIKLVRKVLYDILVHKKEKGGLGYQAKFNFKWVPDLQNATTPLGERAPGQTQKTGAFRHSGIERTALTTLAFTGVVLGLTALGGFRVITSFGKLISRNLDWVSAVIPISTLA